MNYQTRNYRWLIKFFLVIMVLFMTIQPYLFAQSSDSDLANVIKRNWSDWSNNQNHISYAQLIVQLPKPYRGEDAAALAAVAQYLRRNKITVTLDYDAVLQMVSTPKLQDGYRNELQNLAKASKELYAKGLPDFTVLKQGPVGDCFFFSGIGWLANYRPQVLHDAITSLPDGQYKVVFPNGMQTIVNKPTDAEMLFFNSGSTITDGLWVPILEKAVGTILPHYTKRVVNNEEPAYNIALGGAPATIERIWTAHSPHVLYLDKQGSLTEARELLQTMQQQNLMAQALTGKKPPAPSIAGDHVYAIMAFDSTTDIVTIWNPWGDDFTPADGHKGYVRQHGLFKLSLAEFCSFYKVLVVE